MVTKITKYLIWWRRSGIGLRLLLGFVSFALVLLLVYWQSREGDSGQMGGNLLVFLLANLITVVLCILAFLIGRNVVKLVFDRRRNILGSKLRMRLVLAFVSLTIVPTAIIFFLASGLLSSAMEGWFSGQIESAVSSAVEVARQHHQWLREDAKRVSDSLVDPLSIAQTRAELEPLFERVRKEQGVFSIQLKDGPNSTIAHVENAAAAIENFSEPSIPQPTFEKALKSREAFVLAEEKDSSQFIRAYRGVRFLGAECVLIVALRLDPDLTHALTVVNDSYKEYEQIKIFRGPLKSGYLLTLTMITGLILFSAIWFGFYIAKEIAVPIQKLAEGTRAVARGNLDFRIKEMGDDEMSFLVKSFNTMTMDLKQSRVDAERHRLYIETILAHLAVGVIALDREGCVVNLNPAAAKLHSIGNASMAVGRPVKEILGEATYLQIEPLLKQVDEENNELAVLREKELSLISAGQELKVLCTAGRVSASAGSWSATVLIFDDITELVKVQHMSAWREVARRIAHEIKNPLTPIQLSAQRLQKLLSPSNPSPAVMESTQTIIENVDSIKRLANEFSNFARMPTAEFTEADLNEIISASIVPFAESHTDIVFQFIADTRLPRVNIDREQIRRMLINLIDNAIAAVAHSTVSKGVLEGPRVVIKTSYRRAADKVTIEVADNGPGIPDGQKVRVFEPYYTTKESGTGLGLAVVSSVVTDHQGEIRLYDNPPHGAKFVVELPVSPKAATQRRFAAI